MKLGCSKIIKASPMIENRQHLGCETADAKDFQPIALCIEGIMM